MTADSLQPTIFPIVDIAGSTTVVSFSDFTVTGPVSTAQVGCNSGNSGIGIFVEAGATATITHNTIKEIREQPVVQCAAYGLGILVGRAALSTTGTATISGNTIYDYQKNGITVDNTGSTATITHNTITGWSLAFQTANSIQIAQNGIQISRGAVATVDSNTVTSNLCPLGGTCGADLIALTQATGILLYESASGTAVKNNAVSGNDVGIYVQAAPSATKVEGNTAKNNRYAGIAFIDGTYTASFNTVKGPGNVGIAAVAATVVTSVTLSNNDIDHVTASIGAYAASGLTATVLFSYSFPPHP
jgi:parallel beta-helix repeat protein